MAEILIALTIIGVLAVMTIPTLSQNTQKSQFVSGLKKTYKSLTDATDFILAEKGSPKFWMTDVDKAYEAYKEKLRTVEECGSSPGCFAQMETEGKYKFLNGNNVDSTWMTVFSVSRRLILADGVQVAFRGDTSYNAFSSTCSALNAYGSKDLCMVISVDINGEKKPNTFGRDFFQFVLKEDGLYPIGCDDNSTAECSRTQRGWGCACKVIREGAMNY